MSEQAQPHASSITQSSAPPSANAKRHQLSCTHCRQRKIKCDKVQPCSPCQRSSFECIYPERVRHIKKKKSARTSNDELLRRLGRMEDLIEKIKTEGRESNDSSVTEDRESRSPSVPQIRRELSEESRSQDGGSEIPGEGTKKYIGGAFFRSLANEVQFLILQHCHSCVATHTLT